MTLNGTPIDSVGILKGTNGPDGNMVFSEGGPVLPYTFNWTNGSVAGVVTSGFIPGGFNTLEMVVNNTYGAGAPGQGVIYGTTAPFGPSGSDQALFAVEGAVSYSPVPEPFALHMVFVGVGVLLVLRSNLGGSCQRGRKPQLPHV